MVSLAPLAKQEADFGPLTSTAGRNCRNSADSSASTSAVTTPSPNVMVDGGDASSTGGDAGMPAFNYAQLDFEKCEAMKQQQQTQQ